MRRLLAPLLLCAFAAAALASTYQNVTYTNGQSAATTLTLSATDGSNITIASGTKVVVYDENGKKLDPQPEVKIDPSLPISGAKTVTITTVDGNGGPTEGFPARCKVQIEELTTPGKNDRPTGGFN